MWSRGIWVARAAGIALIVVGTAAALGAVDVVSPQAMNMEMPAGDAGSNQDSMPAMPESSNDQGMEDMR